jgi:hypothetical protein
MSILSGALISAGAFALLLAALAWCIPKFLLFTDSRWATFLSPIAALFLCVGGYLRRRHI